MEINEKLEGVKSKLQKIIKEKKYRKANLEREEKAELLATVALCNGELNTCLNSFEIAIRNQCSNIIEGRNEGYDTTSMETTLKGAAIGYLLVKDAMFMLRSVTTYESVIRAYDLLDKAGFDLNRKKRLFGTTGSELKKARKDIKDYVDSETVAAAKKDIVESIFEELIETSDIEQCIKSRREASRTKSKTTTAVPAAKKTVKMSASSLHEDDEESIYAGALDGIEDEEEDVTADVADIEADAILNNIPDEMN